MDTAVAGVHDFLNPSDDQRATCECGEEIRWCSLAKKWFHVRMVLVQRRSMAASQECRYNPQAQPAVTK